MSTTKNSGSPTGIPRLSPDDFRPALSVAIASLDPGPVLFDCLARLERQATGALEVLVVEGTGNGTAERIRRRFPWVQVLEEPRRRSLPYLRGVGLAAARAGLVAVLDPCCLVGEQWVAAAIRVHRDHPEPAAGGPVSLERGQRFSFAAWAGYLYDYWEFAPPLPDGSVAVLPGNNIIYKRDALPPAGTLRDSGFWKAFTNRGLRAAGEGFRMSSALQVHMRRTLPVGTLVASRWHHGRSYAAMRVADAARRERWLRALSTPGLPALFLARQVRALGMRRQYLGWFLACLPVLLTGHLVWAAGECCGYLFGPGRSHDAIRT